MEIWDECLSVSRSRFALEEQSPGSVRNPCPGANRIHILACVQRRTRPEEVFR
ncbi:Aromatic peroxygenase, partial [Clarias magur]